MQSKLGFLKRNFAMDVEEFQWPTRLLSQARPVEQGSPCSVPDPYGIGGNPFGVDVFGSAMQLFDQIAARVLGPGRSDASPPTPTTARCMSACGRDRVPLSEQRDQDIPSDMRAFNLMEQRPDARSETQVRSISASWTIVPHRRAEWWHACAAIERVRHRAFALPLTARRGPWLRFQSDGR